jgi:hypothetical protein
MPIGSPLSIPSSVHHRFSPGSTNGTQSASSATEKNFSTSSGQ